MVCVACQKKKKTPRFTGAGAQQERGTPEREGRDRSSGGMFGTPTRHFVAQTRPAAVGNTRYPQLNCITCR